MAGQSTKRKAKDTSTVKIPLSATHKFGWCLAEEDDDSHKSCRVSYEASTETANWNVGDVVTCGCACHVPTQTSPTRKTRKAQSHG